MRIASQNVCVIALALATAVTAAESPFAGKWKLNPAKSSFTGDTMKFERTPSGTIRWSGSGLSYTFKLDGKEYPGPLRDLIAWKQIDDQTWETTYRRKGILISTDTSKLSPDGKTLTIASVGTKPNGESFHDTTVYERMSGDGGLFGRWKDKEVKVGSPELLEITPDAKDGLTFTIVDLRAMCHPKFDGKDYPVTGPTVPPAVTWALKLTGPRSLEVVSKQNGKPLFKWADTVSEDGRTLTLVGRPFAVNEPFTAVYERQ